MKKWIPLAGLGGLLLGLKFSSSSRSSEGCGTFTRVDGEKVYLNPWQVLAVRQSPRRADMVMLTDVFVAGRDFGPVELEEPFNDVAYCLGVTEWPHGHVDVPGALEPVIVYLNSSQISSVDPSGYRDSSGAPTSRIRFLDGREMRLKESPQILIHRLGGA